MKMKSLNCSLALVFFGCTAGMTVLTKSIAEGLDCIDNNCEGMAPYTLKIITVGEGKPLGANSTSEGQQQNRRVDVGLATRLPLKRTPAMAAAKPVAEQPDNTANKDNGGTFWVSRDPTSLVPALGIKVPDTVVLNQDGMLENPLQFSIATNYRAFIDRWQLLVLPRDAAIDDEPLYSLDGDLEGVVTDVEWNGELSTGERIKAGDQFDIAVRVYGEDGNFDQTSAQPLGIVAAETESEPGKSVQSVAEITIKSLNEQLDDYSQEYAQQSIPVNGSTVVLRGRDLVDVQVVEVNGEKVTVAGDDSFEVEYILPPGDHDFNVNAKRKSGEEITRELEVEVKPGYFFVVGLADLTIGENEISGSIEPLAVDENHYGGDIFVDGRLAFYVKGKVKGKYLMTAQLDTGNEDVSELFSDFHRKDARSVFRRIDPDQYYLVYGDDSTIVDDTDSQGKLYLRVDWDKSHALWGNFNTAFSGTEYAAFNRSLYGAQYRHSSMDVTALGDNRTEISAFMSEAQTVFRHNEFSGTGGSLYYLRDQDIVLGSEKVWVEVRRNNSEQVLQKVELERGRDYEFDEFQGRIILTRPLLSVSSQTGPSIIRDEPQPGDNTYLVVDYEYVPADFVSGDDAATGLRGKRWIGNHVAIGGTWAHDNSDVGEYDVKAFDVTVKKSNNTYVRLEVAESESSQTSGSFGSDDGGLSFTPFSSNEGLTAGGAIGIEARVSVNEVVELEKPVTIAAWAKNREAGFSTASLDAGTDTTDTGVEVVAEVSDVLAISGRATRLAKESQSRDSVIALQADYRYNDNTIISGEIRRIHDEDLESGSSEAATLGAGKVNVQLSETVEAYGIVQGALDRTGNYRDNTLLTAGARAKLNDRTSVSGEVSTGDRGTNLMLGAEHELSDTYSVYSNVSLLNDQSDTLEKMATFGQRKTVSDKLKVYSEHQFSNEDNRSGVTNTIGLSNTFNRYASGTLSFQSSRIEDDANDIIERDTLTAGLGFKKQQSHVTTKLEYRKDDSSTVDTDQWVMITNIEYRHSPALRVQGRFNHSSTEDHIAGDDATFTEAGIGFAYRPVVNDRLNLLGRYTYLYDLPPLSQSDKTDRRASIFSVEGNYELAKRWTVGAKLAHRQGEIRAQRQSGEWTGNDASLTALRMRYKVPFGVNAMGSYHWLGSDATDSMRHGALLSVGYNVSNMFQFSVGYNFTSFDDNLVNDDYDVKGWFLNFVGKY